ncbi:MAG: aminotransferase class I/II-fold pyridoxal phosphate-dependent enzyme [Oscillospiraceae bacterium]
MAIPHGGDWAGFVQEYSTLPLDFSANTSPLGLTDGIRAAITTALSTADRYPDPLCRTLCRRLAESHGVPREAVLCGGGASDLIFRLAQAKRGQSALVTAPTFGEYAHALTLNGCTVEHFPLLEETGFAVTADILERITPELGLLFLCEPNNPTGRTTEPALLRAILEKCKRCHTLLVVDECFLDCLDEPAAHTLESLVPDFPNLLLLKAFTKSYALAGLRLGYALCADGALLDKMRDCGQPWAVSSLAQAAGLAALDETDYLPRLRTLLAAERPRLQAGLTELGCTVYPGEANFLLFHCADDRLAQRLRPRGILIRDCADFQGLGGGFYRIAVRTAAENVSLLNDLRGVL